MPQDKTICVIGLGYVGLPTALTFCRAGYKVLGYDKNARLVNNLNAGHTDINEVGMASLLQESLKSKRFQAFDTVQSADAYFICVPTPVNTVKEPDLGAVFSAVGAIQTVIKPDDLVVLESTSPVGTTRKIYTHLSRHLGSAGTIFAAYCPERILPGKVLEELSSLDRVIGGIDMASAALAKTFFSRLTSGNCYETTAETAEFVKLAENSFRDINIAFANELKNLCDQHDVDIERVRHFANMHPRVNILQSGIGVGGHCIPVDPWFLVDALPSDALSVIRTARQLNDRQPLLVADRIIQAAHQYSAKKIAFFGLTYKANVNDFRESPAMDIVKHVVDTQQFTIEVCDPFLSSETEQAIPAGAVVKHPDAISPGSLSVFLVAHDAFADAFHYLRTQGNPILDVCHMHAVAESAIRPAPKMVALAH